MEKIVILGGTQFIGKALVNALAGNGEKEREIICFHRGLHPARKQKQVREILGDRFSASDIRKLFSADYDMVVDVSGTEYEAIRLAAEYAAGHTKRYFFISSSSVYDAQKITVHKETEDLRIEGKSAYAAAKIRGERLIADLFSNYTIVRPSKVYGPDNYYFSERAFADLIRKNPVVPLVRDPILHFTNVADLTRGILSLMQGDHMGIYNVAGKEPAPLSEFIRKIADLTGQEVSFVRSLVSGVPFTELEDRVLDCTKMEKECGWRPEISLDEGLNIIFKREV